MSRGNKLYLGHRVWPNAFIACALLLVAMVGTARALPREEPTVEGLKARISSAPMADKAHLCMQVARLQLDAADKLYSAGEIEKAQADLTEVVAYSELARDYSIQSHKYQKQAEINVRIITRKLTEILHTLDQPEQAAVKDAVKRLDQVRDDLLASMFKKGAK